MAASYQSDTVPSPIHLLQDLVTWLFAQGWAADHSDWEGTGWRAHLSKGGQYVNLRAANAERIWPALSGFWDADPTGGHGIGLYLGDGYSGAAAWDAQSGRPVRSDGTITGAGMNLPAGAISGYHFFDDGFDNITVVVERTPGVFSHMGFGPSMVKRGFTEDLWYFFGSNSAHRTTWNDPLNGDLPGYNVTGWAPFAAGPKETIGGTLLYPHATNFVRLSGGQWAADPGVDDATRGGCGRILRCSLNPVGSGMQDGEYPNYQYLLGRTRQTAFGGGLLNPLRAYLLTDPAARYAPLGHLPTVRWCEAVGNGFNAGEILSIEGENWMLFPNFAVLKAA